MIQFQEIADLWRISCTSIYFVSLKEVANVYDLGYRGVEKDFPEQISSLLYRKRKNNEYSPKINNTTKVIL